MARRVASSVLSALGLTANQERLYQRLLPLSGSLVSDLVARLDVRRDVLILELAPLRTLGLIDIKGDRVRVVGLSAAVSARVAAEAEAARRLRQRLDDLSTAIPYLTAAVTRPAPSEVSDMQALEGEVTSGGNPLKLLTALVEHSRGDLLWLRPDAWRFPRESAMVRVIAAAVASGRRSRAIYPVVALQEAPDAMQARADAGEEIRFLADLPTRMIVVGNTHAVLPEPLGFADEPRLLIRQPAIVESLALLFETLWERAAPVPALEPGRQRTDRYRFLLQQLVAGAKDEQIARSLGISLRTVRRRVAELLIDLGVETRFQAGAEAVRRGWL